MPFWWARRRKPWYGRWRYRQRRYKKRKVFRRRRRRPRRPLRRRRRRRRRYKVRKKKQTIKITQWQPDSIRKCKIKGLGFLVGGAQGAQFYCYTNQKTDYTQPKAPGGGGFGCEVFSLEYLYKQWEAHKNIWTTSNDYKDLCRYTGCRFSFFRHRDIDFIINYERQPPFNLNKDTYSNIHPQNLLLKKHHRVLLSTKNNPTGKTKLTLKIKPPKQMSNKWHFQEQFAEYGLLQIQAAACNMQYSLYGPNTQSPNITVYALNTQFFRRQNWAQALTQPWTPYLQYPTQNPLSFKSASGSIFKPNLTSYASTIAKSTGFFNPGVLQAIEVLQNEKRLHERPVAIGRYNPEEDSGIGNKVWFTSVLSDHAWAPPSDSDLIIVEKPLYVIFYGFWDWIVKAKGKVGYMTQGMFVVQSPAIKTLTPTTQKAWPILDYSFIQGKMPYDETATQQDLDNWYPTAMKQRQIINAFVECGPYTPKLSNLPSSTWQLPYRYVFYFKWGGPQISDQNVQDPKHQETYPVPDKLLQTIQIVDPLQQSYKAMLRSWDFRRGIVTSSALKRMSKNLQPSESIQSDDSEPPEKKKKVTAEVPYKNQETEEIQSCLLSLFEKDTYPEQTEDIRQLIHHQQQQQEKLKLNIIQLLMHLKRKQRMLQLQTGLD